MCYYRASARSLHLSGVTVDPGEQIYVQAVNFRVIVLVKATLHKS